MTTAGDSPRKSSESSWLTLAVFLALLATRTLKLDAAERSLVSRIHEIEVLETSPTRWSSGDWQPIPLDEYHELLRRAQPPDAGPKPVWIDEAEYRAILDSTGDLLSHGTLRVQIRRASDRTELLILDPLNVAVTTPLHWEDGPAVSGTLPDGRMAVVVDREQGILTGDWTLQGRRFPHETEFDIQVARASVSRLFLETHRDQILRTSWGDTTSSIPAGKKQRRLWEIRLGNGTACRIGVSQQAALKPRTPRRIVELNSRYSLSQTELQAHVDCLIKAFDAPTTTIDFLIPNDLTVDSVRLADRISLPWKQVSVSSPPLPDAAARKMTVALPTPLADRGTHIHILGHASVPLDRQWSLPVVVVSDADFLSGQLSLGIRSPLELRSFEQHFGLRQIKPPSTTEDGETYVFQQDLPNPTLSVDVGYPQPAISAHAFSLVNAESRKWSLTADIEWISRTGSTFSVQCQVPSRWKITDVRIDSDDASLENGVAYWGEKKNAKGHNTLTIEFRNALLPGQPKRLLVTAEHPLPGTARRSDLPVLFPVGCNDADVLLAFSHRQEDEFVLQTSDAVQQLSESEVSDTWRESSLWSRIPKEQPTWFLLSHSNTSRMQGKLEFQSRRDLTRVSSHVDIKVTRKQFTEKVLLRCQPAETPVQRMWVYLTSPLPRPKWRVINSKRVALHASRLPVTRHDEWSLPSGGELWELQLSPPDRREFQVEVTSEFALTDSFVPALAFVPRVDDFRGVVAFTQENDTSFEPELSGVQPLIAPSTPQTTTTVDTSQRTQQWTYQGPTDTLTLRKSERNPVRQPEPTVAELRSLLVSDANERDHHWISFSLRSSDAAGEFRFQLPEPARLMGITLSGQPTTYRRVGPDFVVALFSMPPDAADRQSRVEIEYSTPVQRHFLHDTRTIIVPRVASPVVHFVWTYATSPGIQLSGSPTALRLMNHANSLHWTQRFFGPLGRAVTGQPFNPFFVSSWRDLFAPRNVSPTPQADASRFAPAGWIAQKAVGVEAPAELELSAWRHPQLTSLAWSGLLFSLILGLLLRIGRVGLRSRIGAVWLAVCVVAAWSVPAVFGEIAGGCLVGALIATLVPRTVIARKLSHETPSDISLGSTETHKHIPALLLLVGMAVLTNAALAQPPAPPTRPAASSTASLRTSNAEEYDVLLPVDSTGMPSKRLPVAFVDGELLTLLRNAARHAALEPDYAITSADYRVDVDKNDLAVMRVQYELALLQTTVSTRVFLPIQNVNLAPNECRVNGRPTEILRSADGTGYFVTLPTAIDRPESRSPKKDELDAKEDELKASQAGEASDRRRTIELTMYPITSIEEGKHAIDVRIPPVATSRLTANLPRDAGTVNIPSVRGQIVRSADGATVSAQLGAASRLALQWSAQTFNSPVAMTADVLQVIEARPGLHRLRCRVRYTVESGSVDFVTWRLPPRAILQNVAADGLAGYDIWPHQASGNQVIMKFDSAKSGQFVVDADFLMANSDPFDQLRFTLDQLPIGPETLSIASTQLAITTTSEYELTPVTVPTDRMTQLDPTTFAENWNADGEHERLAAPIFAYATNWPLEFAFSLETRRPRRTVMRANQVGQVDHGRIQWTITVELETTRAPAFQHTLLCDSLIGATPLQIDSISVREAEAERLARWTQSDDRLVLFLKDKTTGIQSIVLKGTQPLATDGDTPIPTMRVQGVPPIESQIRIYHAASTSVDIGGADRVSSLDESVERTEEQSNETRLERFRWPAAGGQPFLHAVENRLRQLRYHSATRLKPISGRQWQVTTQLEFFDDPGARTPIQVVIPPRLAVRCRISATGARYVAQTASDGSREVSVQPDGTLRTTCLLTIVSNVVLPGGASWTVPRVIVADSAETERFLLIPDQSPARVIDATARRVRPALIPPSIAAMVSTSANEKFVVYQTTSSTSSFEFTERPSEEERVSVPLVDTMLWIENNGAVVGQTEIVVDQSDHAILPVNWPADTRLNAVLVNSRVVGASLTDQRLEIPLGNHDAAVVVQLFWSGARGSRAASIHSVSQTLPMPVAPVGRRLVTLFPAEDSWIPHQTGVKAVANFDLACEYLDGLLAASGNLADELNVASHRLLWRAIIIHEQVQAYFGTDTDPGKALTVEQHQRLAGITTRILQRQAALDESSDATAAPTASETARLHEMWTTRLDRRSGACNGRLPAGDELPSISLWTMRNVAWTTGCAILAAFLAVPFFFRLMDPRVAEWLSRHGTVSWIVLGVFWWFCLTPSLLGLILIIAGVANLWKSRKHKTTEIGMMRE